MGHTVYNVMKVPSSSAGMCTADTKIFCALSILHTRIPEVQGVHAYKICSDVSLDLIKGSGTDTRGLRLRFSVRELRHEGCFVGVKNCLGNVGYI